MVVDSAQKVGTELLKVFGLPSKNCKGFELRCFVDEVVTIKAEYFTGINEDTKELERIIKTFKLVEE